MEQCLRCLAGGPGADVGLVSESGAELVCSGGEAIEEAAGREKAELL